VPRIHLSTLRICSIVSSPAAITALLRHQSISNFSNLLLPPHDLVVLRFFIADIGASWLSKTLIAGIFWPRAF